MAKQQSRRSRILEKQFRIEPTDFEKWRGRINPIPVEMFQSILDLIIHTPEGFTDTLTLLLDAFTQFVERAYRASFLLD